MAQEEQSNRKEKKAQRDADRRKKSKKRKIDEVVEDGDLEQQNEFDEDFLPLDSGAVDRKVGDTKHKSSKSSSKKRKASDEVESAHSNQQNGDAPALATKPSKRKKTNHDRVEDKDAPAGDSNPLKQKKQKKIKQASTDGGEPKQVATPADKGHRFILFVGNLPYGATDATVRSHFKKLEPFTLRHRTDPKTGKSKGFAFLEFENYDRMKTCLKLYHHSMFDPDKDEVYIPEEGEAEEESGPQKAKPGKAKNASKRARRINVELTAGGGGKAEGRKEKIRVKNERLGEQRQRRAEAERKEREKKAAEEGGEANATKPAKKVKKPEKPEKVEEVETNGEAEAMPDVHPSRLARITA